jgi:hypothetical protein
MQVLYLFPSLSNLTFTTAILSNYYDDPNLTVADTETQKVKT